MEHVKRFLLILGLFLVFGIPAMAPEVFIGISVILWPIVYSVIWIAGIGHDAASNLPWTVVNPEAASWSVLFIAALFGLFMTGIRGSVAMAAFWGPMALIPTFLLWTGVAASGTHGWYGYVHDNYQSTACEMGIDGYYMSAGNTADHCVNNPNPGLALPTFVTNYPSGKILEVIPYGGTVSSGSAAAPSADADELLRTLDQQIIGQQVNDKLDKIDQFQKDTGLTGVDSLITKLATQGCKTKVTTSADGTTQMIESICE